MSGLRARKGQLPLIWARRYLANGVRYHLLVEASDWRCVGIWATFLGMNTVKKGQVRTMVFEEEGTWYGVAMEFNIVVEGDEYAAVHFDLLEAMKGYVGSLKKIKGTRTDSPYALNQSSDQEYETMWDKLQNNKPIPSPVQMKYYGVTNV